MHLLKTLIEKETEKYHSYLQNKQITVPGINKGLAYLQKFLDYSKCNLSKLKELGKTAMQQAYNAVSHGGSSTLLLYFLHLNYLHITYIGDTQIAVFRPGYSNIRRVFKSKPNKKDEKRPGQLVKVPSDLQLTQMKEYQRGKYSDIAQRVTDICPVEEAITMQLQVENGDIIVAGTDGFWDNIYDAEVLSLLQYEFQVSKDQQLAKRLARILHRYAMQMSLEDKRGKLDDVTVVVSIISRAQTAVQSKEFCSSLLNGWHFLAMSQAVWFCLSTRPFLAPDFKRVLQMEMSPFIAASIRGVIEFDSSASLIFETELRRKSMREGRREFTAACRSVKFC